MAAAALGSIACGQDTARVARVDPANGLPFGFVDNPPAGSSVGWRVRVAGWALDDQGIAEIRIFLDDHLVATTAPDTARPDVAKVFPELARRQGRVGWSREIDMPQGSHTIVVQAVDRLGLSRDLGAFPVTRPR